MKWLALLVVLNLVFRVRTTHDYHRKSWLVQTEQGPIKGYKALDGDFFVFYGVPYATAPSGKDRFKAPLPPPVWTEPLEAVDTGIICPQKDILGVIPKSRRMQENCLIATIYVPDNLEYNIPVVVYVHGGAYLFAYGDYVTPRNFAKTKRVILVTFNYRLGAHGFLCLGTKDVPGNAGMKDQVELLRWVKKNIVNFRGNPNDITIAGYSAGSAAVDTLVLSKMTRGLINKVIPESGVSISTFNIQYDPLKNAKLVAKMLNFTNIDDFNALEEFYKTISFEKLNSVNSMNSPQMDLFWCPCIEKDVGVERFLEDSPINIISSGNFPKLPLLCGFATMEGLFRLPLFEIWKDQMNENFSDFLPADLEFKSKEEKNQIAMKVKQFYFGNKLVSSANILGYVDFFTDAFINFSTMRSVKLLVEAGHHEVYLYEYVHVDEDTINIPYTNVRGPDHCAQTWAVLDGLNLTHTNELLISNSLREMKNLTRELWLNFMITGKPVPEGSPFPAWPPTGANAVPHMALDKKLELRDNFERNLEKRYLFWDKIYKKHYRIAIAPRPTTSFTSSERRSLSTALVIIIISLFSLYFLLPSHRFK